MGAPILDSKDFRHTVGGFATGVCVMTVPDPDHVNGHVLGMTANSFTSVSLDPMLILWCVDVRAHRYGVYAEAKSFGVNILGAGQEDLSRRFARENAHIVPEEMLLSDIHPLMLRGTAGFLGCDLHDSYLAGDHRVIIGRVTAMTRDESAGALTFHRGRYGAIVPPEPVEPKSIEEAS
ncbi:MAG: flavin reductase family protein [Asticcacaulis sp.]